jgi:SAM domain (Sterile alpha motif)
VEQWLKSFQFEQYLGVFNIHGYDMLESVATLDEFALDLFKITKRGHHMLLLNKAKKLKNTI